MIVVTKDYVRYGSLKCESLSPYPDINGREWALVALLGVQNPIHEDPSDLDYHWDVHVDDGHWIGAHAFDGSDWPVSLADW